MLKTRDYQDRLHLAEAITGHKYLTPGVLGRIMGISEQTIQRIVDRGEIKGAFTVPPKHRFRRIPWPAAAQFMHGNGYDPKQHESLQGKTVILSRDPNRQASSPHEIIIQSSFELGALFTTEAINRISIDRSIPDIEAHVIQTAIRKFYAEDLEPRLEVIVESDADNHLSMPSPTEPAANVA